MPNTTLYLFQNPSLNDLDQSSLSQSEINYSQTLATERKKEFLTGRLLCKKIISETLQCQAKDIEIKKTDFGKPYLENNPIYFNLSHSNNAILIGISTSEIGVDIQEITNKPFEKSFKKLFPNYPTPTQENFYILWTRYEALVKALGKSIFTVTNHPSVPFIFDLLELNKTKRSKTLSVFSNKLNNTMFSVAICGHISTIKTNIR
jgi:phosphopantetheinyl transferase